MVCACCSRGSEAHDEGVVALLPYTLSVLVLALFLSRVCTGFTHASATKHTHVTVATAVNNSAACTAFTLSVTSHIAPASLTQRLTNYLRYYLTLKAWADAGRAQGRPQTVQQKWDVGCGDIAATGTQKWHSRCAFRPTISTVMSYVLATLSLWPQHAQEACVEALANKVSMCRFV